MSDVFVSELNIYPVKSLSQISLQNSKLDRFGLYLDRRWMIVDEKGTMITQRKISRMCLIQTRIENNKLILHANDMNDLNVTADINNLIKVNVWNDICNAQDCGNEAAEWLSFFLNIECRLVYFPEDEIRQVDTHYAKKHDVTAFSDGFPLLLISQASLDDLNKRLETPIEMARFRPNIVVSGCTAFAEDEWKNIQINNINFRIVKPCSRCSIPNIDIHTAQKQKEPSLTLSTYRKHDNNIFFGQNIIADSTGELSIGMPIRFVD